MFVQKTIGIDITVKPKIDRPKKPTITTEERIKQTLKEWNTIVGVELYKDLYNICSQLFLATQDNKLAWLDYYIDHEKDNETGEEFTVMYAEIKDTWNLPMPQRYYYHKKLLERVMSGDTTLLTYNEIIINENSEDDEKCGQLSLFN